MDPTTLGIIVAASLGIVEVIKKTGISSRWYAVVALVVGFGMTLLFTHSVSWATLYLGVIAGLSAAGVYSGVKTTITPSDSSSTYTTAPTGTVV